MTTRAFIALLSAWVVAAPANAQRVDVPLTPDRWTASDTIKFEQHLGRPALYINTGVALANGAELTDGTIEFDMASAPRSSNLGMAFHASSMRDMEVIFFRAGAGRSPETVQYAPAFNGVATAWQIYHYDGANAVAEILPETWIHVKVHLAGDTARMYMNGDTAPTLIVPRLAGTGGRRLGVWASNFGRGAWFSNVWFTPEMHAPPAPAPPPPRGTITDWQLSQTFEASTLAPGTLPDLERLTWEPVRVEAQGFVLVNRYRVSPSIIPPTDPVTREPLVDSISHGRVKGSRVVFARTTIRSDRDRLARLEFTFSDAIAIYLDGRPLYSEMNPSGFRGDALGVMDARGKVVFLPLTKGTHEVVYAVTEFFGGWAFSGKLDP